MFITMFYDEWLPPSFVILFPKKFPAPFSPQKFPYTFFLSWNHKMWCHYTMCIRRKAAPFPSSVDFKALCLFKSLSSSLQEVEHRCETFTHKNNVCWYAWLYSPSSRVLGIIPWLLNFLSVYGCHISSRLNVSSFGANLFILKTFILKHILWNIAFCGSDQLP